MLIILFWLIFRFCVLDFCLIFGCELFGNIGIWSMWDSGWVLRIFFRFCKIVFLLGWWLICLYWDGVRGSICVFLFLYWMIVFVGVGDWKLIGIWIICESFVFWFLVEILFLDFIKLFILGSKCVRVVSGIWLIRDDRIEFDW